MRSIRNPFLFLLLALLPLRATPSLSDLGIESQQGDFHGFAQESFTLPESDISCRLVAPKKAAPGNPWVWRARFWGHEPAFDLALLAQGYHLAYCDVADLFGSPSALARWDRFYKLSQRLGLHPKPVLEGMSRGGLIIFNWAKANPEKVTAIYADNPVCDIRSWPKDKAPKSWQRCLEVHELRAEDVDKFTGNPIDHLAPLARAEVPLFLVLGAKDRTVPIAENALILEKNYLAHGGSVRKWIKANDAHHPHGLHPPTPLVDAILALTP